MLMDKVRYIPSSTNQQNLRSHSVKMAKKRAWNMKKKVSKCIKNLHFRRPGLTKNFTETLTVPSNSNKEFIHLLNRPIDIWMVPQ